MFDSKTTQDVYERFLLVSCAPALMASIVSAADVNLFQLLSARPGSTFDDLQKELKLPTHSLRVLLLSLCSMDLVVKKDGAYSNSEVAKELLATNGADAWHHILRGWQTIHNRCFADGHLTTALREGKNTGLAVF